MDKVDTLRKRAASGFRPEKKLTIAEARQLSRKMIREWADAQ